MGILTVLFALLTTSGWSGFILKILDYFAPNTPNAVEFGAYLGFGNIDPLGDIRYVATGYKNRIDYLINPVLLPILLLR